MKYVDWTILIRQLQGIHASQSHIRYCTYLNRPAPTGFEGDKVTDAVRGAFFPCITSAIHDSFNIQAMQYYLIIRL